MDLSQIGYLVPLKGNSEDEDTSIPKLSISNGSNIIGRNNLAVSDKRVSRRHVTITASSSATLTVDGTNPVVVKSGGERKKLRRGEQVALATGDIIELIPGHHFFKYVALGNDSKSSSSSSPFSSPNTKKRGFNGAREVLEIDQQTRKKTREASRDKTHVANNPKVEGMRSGVKSCEQAICRFNVSDDELPATFRLLKVQGLPAWANTSCVSITDVVQGDIVVAILSNYMVDIDWLMSACPVLAKVPHVLVVHGEGDGVLEQMKITKPANWILHKPPLPISFGTHHSKAMLLVYPRGVRIIVHTANLIYIDWNNKSQGLWMQDFPWKDAKNPHKGCGFENDLVDYLHTLKWPEFTAKLQATGSLSINPSFFRKFDYSNAMVRLIASVPGYHTGANLKKWGHMKLRSILQEFTFEDEFIKSPLVYQFSSLGSLDEKWMTELATSMSSGCSEDKTPLGLGEPQIIWPTVEDVRCSLEGYGAGNAIPSPLKNVEKTFLKKYWAKWKAVHTGRCRAMPHIKTFTRYNGQKLAWLLLTSANLSKAAWGALQKNNSQLMIRSYEHFYASNY
uniref:FHA domain-containing protein n=1 Tax=Rhizophora mucronata TaxID=61149 RepID=A0A2P2JIM7_RHIMU